jgi:predicted 3-demethylubiquinone-9 3-methyltransferase (glyoxalase superfamily)
MSPGETNTVFKGYVSDVRFLNGVCLYSSNFYPGPTPFTSSVTVGSTTYKPAILLNGTDSGVLDASRTVDLETIGDSRVTTFSPYTAGYYSNYFDGSGDYLSVSTGTIATGTGDLTLECWAYRISTTSLQTVVNLNTYLTGILIRWETTKVTIYVGGTDYSYNTPTDIPLGAWVHIALVRTSGVFRFYVNGVQATTFNTNYSLSITSVTIGTSSHDTSDEFYGYISNVRFVSGTAIIPPVSGPTAPLTAISGTSLLTCQSNSFKDNSTNNFTITRNGDTKVANTNPFQINSGQSYYFDGSGDSLYAVSSPNFTFVTGDFTIEFWLYFNATANRQDIMWISTTGAATDRLGISWNLTSGNLTYYISPTIGNAINYAWTPTAGQWYHIALARSSGSTKLFVNGTQGGSTYSDSRNYNSQYALYIGQDSTGLTSPFNGYLSDIRITRGIARYTTTFTPPTTPFKLN